VSRPHNVRAPPTKDESHDVEAISFNAGKMIIGLLEEERCADKPDVVCVKEAFADMRGHVWLRLVFGIPSKIGASKRQDPEKMSVSHDDEMCGAVVLVFEFLAINDDFHC
jgi:hypothetical protein